MFFLFCFFCHSRESGNPGKKRKKMDSRLRGNDKEKEKTEKEKTEKEKTEKEKTEKKKNGFPPPRSACHSWRFFSICRGRDYADELAG